MNSQKVFDAIARGVEFVKNNPQVIYTIFLMVVIPLAFIASGQQFLQATTSARERLEKDRIGLMQDTFVEFAPRIWGDWDRMTSHFEHIVQTDPTISDLALVRPEGEQFVVVASVHKDTVGHPDTQNAGFYSFAAVDKEQSWIINASAADGRHWKAFRAVTDDQKNIIGYLMTDVSMAQLDNLINTNIRNAYIFLAVILVLIFILLMRHARIIDYTVLYRRLKEVDEMKDDFVSIASHELRAPLTALKWQASELHTDEKSMNIFQNSITQLEKLVEDMLDVSRIQQGRIKYDFRELDPSEIIDTAVTFFKPTAEEKGLKINYEKTPLPLTSVDPERLRQVTVNLISNAIKYTREGEITITAGEDRNKVVIRIRDTGLGISAEDQTHLFQKFQRIKSEETSHISGTGLGLWITKQIVEAMHGTVAVESIKGVGSSFIVSFPTVTAK